MQLRLVRVRGFHVLSPAGWRGDLLDRAQDGQLQALWRRDPLVHEPWLADPAASARSRGQPRSVFCVCRAEQPGLGLSPLVGIGPPFFQTILSGKEQFKWGPFETLRMENVYFSERHSDHYRPLRCLPKVELGEYLRASTHHELASQADQRHHRAPPRAQD